MTQVKCLNGKTCRFYAQGKCDFYHPPDPCAGAGSSEVSWRASAKKEKEVSWRASAKKEKEVSWRIESEKNLFDEFCSKANLSFSEKITAEKLLDPTRIECKFDILCVVCLILYFRAIESDDSHKHIYELYCDLMDKSLEVEKCITTYWIIKDEEKPIDSIKAQVQAACDVERIALARFMEPIKMVLDIYIQKNLKLI